ncbi:uncharacterized protein LOC132846928 [Tachysurus vachellii]|uniref:uncharacterized protein LOC132846928 n=1 Tax=Tachysurus vachellii TaxID=175792 RepID=UPI00296B3F19|nr:uncharacterized protein LOC132846928 [Tachysurus vachellii]
MLRNAVVLFRTLTVLAFAVGHEGLHVHGPSGPVVAQLGGSVLLPCFVESPLPLEGLQVEWRKTDSDSLVGLFQQGKSRPDLQSQGFRGRVDFFPHELTKGNFSILLKNVVEEDTGGYRCKVNTTQDSSEVIMEVSNIWSLVVTGADRAIFAPAGQDVILNCSVDSNVPASEIEEVTWKKMDREREHDISVLLYQDKKIFPDSSHESYWGRVDFFSSEIPKGNFSLKLMDVNMEDKGEFTCEVHTRNMSGQTTVVLQRIGLSALHVSILVLCSVALVLSVGLCVPVFNKLRRKVTNRKSMTMYALLTLCPNICICIAFGLWSSEGIFSEIVACSAVSIGRPIMLIKTAPYLDRLPDRVQKYVKALAVPLYYLIPAVASCLLFFDNLLQAQTAYEHMKTLMAVVISVSVAAAVVLAVIDLNIFSTVCLETFNGALLALFIHQSNNANFDLCAIRIVNNPCINNIPIVATLPPLIVALMMLLFFQKHYFQRKPFGCLHIAVASVFVSLFSLLDISFFVLMGFILQDFTKVWIFPVESVIYIIAWLAVIALLRRQRQGCCSQWRGLGYLCCVVIVLFLISAIGALCLHFATEALEHKKDRAGYVALVILLHVLAATLLFKHPTHLPEFLHVMIFMFGSVGLVVVNSLVLVVELFLKSGKGARTVEDLRVIVLPFETAFVLAWLALQIYSAWMRLQVRIKNNFEEGRVPAPEEMEALPVRRI